MPDEPGFIQSLRREGARLAARPWDLAFITWLPLLACALMWWVLSAGLPERLAIGVLDQDQSAISRQIARWLDATPGLHVIERYADEGQMDRALTNGRVHAAVLLPHGLAARVKQGRSASVVLLHNAQLGTHSGLIQRDVRTVIATVSAGIELTARNKRGEPMAGARASMEPIRTTLVSLFNTAGNYEQFLTVALIAALLHIMAMAAGAWVVGCELRDRSLGGWLGPAPGARVTLAALLGKLLPAWLGLSGVGGAWLAWLALGRGWSPAGSLAWTLLAFAVFTALSIALGAFFAALTRSLRTALSATGFISAPAFAFGGVGFPLAAMPAPARAWALALPYTHYARVQAAQLQIGAPLADSLAAPLAMALAGALLLGASAALLARTARQPESWGAR
ncbi:MAG: ABC transporter permease [Proteobacteria bacterium]|nr:ABC transporter permease [Pseudomonadota bacterium]